MLCCKKIDAMSAGQLFTFGMRMTFGFWLLFVGLMKWINGHEAFINWIAGQFSAVTWLPAILVTLTSWIILIAEPLIGAWLLTGKSQRCAWLCAAKLMFLLTLGQTMLMEYQTVSNNWQYLVLTLVCAGLSSNSGCCSSSKSCCSEDKTEGKSCCHS